MLIAVSTLVLVLVALGWRFRRCARVHVPLMLSAMTLDFGLLLYIEGTRHAIAELAQSMQAPTPNPLLTFHVAVSALSLVLYGMQAWTGFRLLKGVQPCREKHRKLAYGFIACRLLNYVTSFFVVQSVATING